MTRKNFLTLAGLAGLLLIAGLWMSAHRASQQADLGGGRLFTDLEPAVGDITEIRLSKGDGSRTTLKRGAAGWTVAERNFPADGARVRDLVLNLVALKVIETKTSDPANYARLGVESADSPTATSTLVEVVSPKKTWSLLVGKGAEGRALYVRKPEDKASALAAPVIVADPDQKRWVDRQLTDVAGAEIHDIAVTPASGAAYLLTRAQRGATDLVLSPVPKGRKPASSMSLDGQGEVLAAFNFDDVHALESPAAAPTDKAVWRTFDGQVLEFAGHRVADKAFVTVSVHRDPALAAQFPAPSKAMAAAGAAPAKSTEPKPSEQTVERLAARTNGVQFEIPSYKYDALFKPLEDLLEKPPAPPASAAKPASKKK